MFSDRKHPTDYATFKRRSRWRAFAVAFAFDAFLISLFGILALLISWSRFR